LRRIDFKLAPPQLVGRAQLIGIELFNPFVIAAVAQSVRQSGMMAKNAIGDKLSHWCSVPDGGFRWSGKSVMLS